MVRTSQTLQPRTVILLDGAEQLSWPGWHWFRWRTRRVGGLIITTHRAGRLPTLWECRASAELLVEIAAQLLALEHNAVRAQANRLHAMHGGNLREALRAWYDLYAEADAGDPVRTA